VKVLLFSQFTKDVLYLPFPGYEKVSRKKNIAIATFVKTWVSKEIFYVIHNKELSATIPSLSRIQEGLEKKIENQNVSKIG
jgi:hypothetical protein